MRHLPIKFSPLRTAVLGLPWKARCGAQQRGLATAEAGTPVCPDCASHRFGLRFDPNLGFDVGAADDTQTHPLQLSVSQALDMARREQRQGLLSQSGYDRIVSRLEDADRYPFHMALVGHQIRVKTGAVNVVDREEPMALGNGDTGTMGPANLWSSVGVLPSGAEMNDNPGGTLELAQDKPRRTEGDLHEQAEFGNNLRSLTAANALGTKVGERALLALLNEGVGLEYSQQVRNQVYSELIRHAYGDLFADDLFEKSRGAMHMAGYLARHVKRYGGKLSYRVDPPAPMDAADPDVLGHVLAELWTRGQSAAEYYLDLRESASTSAMRHTVNTALEQELEHCDALLRLAHRLNHEAQAVGGPESPFESNALQWEQSYADENTFEGLDKMGDETRTAMRLSRVAMWKVRAEMVKRKTHFAEIPVHIEWEPGDVREGVSPEGIPWERKMQNAYGFIPDTEGADGEPLDVYLGGSTGSRRIFIVNQKGKDGEFDEEKIMLGFSTPESAEAAYRSHYPKGGDNHFDSIHEMGMDSFLREYVTKDDDSGYRPKIVMKQVPVEDLDIGAEDLEDEEEPEEGEGVTLDVSLDKAAVHGPGDSDGCGGGSSPPKSPPARGYGKPSGKPPKAPEGKPAPLPTSTPGAKKAPWDNGKPAAPGIKPGTPLGKVDTSKPMSPAEQAWNRDQGHGKKIHDQIWRLLGGPGFNPNQFGINAAQVTAEQYETPVTGPEPTDGEPGGDELMGIHAALDIGLDDVGLAKRFAWADRGVGYGAPCPAPSIRYSTRALRSEIRPLSSGAAWPRIDRISGSCPITPQGSTT